MGGRDDKPAEALRNPLVKKVRSLDDFKPDQDAIDETLAAGAQALEAALRKRLGVKNPA